VKVEYLSLADAANQAEDGKFNILGMGARIINYERLPGFSPLAIVAAVSAMASETGEYPVEIRIEEPDGTKETIVKSRAIVNAKVDDERVPTGIALSVGMMRPFRIEGVHKVRLNVGPLEASYEFLVRVAPVPAASERPPTQSSQPVKRRRTGRSAR